MTDQPKPAGEDQLKFSLDTNGIELKALAKILQDTHLALKEIAKTTSQPEPDLKIYPFKQGSFEYSLVLDTAFKTFAVAMSPLAAFKLYLEVKKQLKDLKKPKDAPELTKDLVEQLRANTALVNSMSALLKTISEHAQGFTLTGQDQRPVKLSTREIQDILEREAREKSKDKDETQIIEKKEVLFLVRMSPAKYGMWEFIYGDIKIMADLDKHLKDFYKKKLTSGAKVEVQLKIWQKFNQLARAWENTKYRIIHVYKYEL